jgi:hypothetical protein
MEAEMPPHIRAQCQPLTKAPRKMVINKPMVIMQFALFQMAL